MKAIIFILIFIFSINSWADLGLACGSLISAEDEDHMFRNSDYPTHAYADAFDPNVKRQFLRDLIYEGVIFTEFYHSERGYDSYLKIIRKTECDGQALPCKFRIGLDVDGNGKYEAVFNVNYDPEMSDEVFGTYYKGTVIYYSNNPEEPARDRALCVFSFL